jgi:SAM-dependent methyltransferase
MSSPLANLAPSAADDLLVGLHQRLSHKTRVAILARLIAGAIARHTRAAAPVCLDVGCGDFSMARTIQSLSPQSRWHGLDVYPLDDARKSDPAWATYRSFDGTHMPFEDASFDVILICDALHHASADQRRALAREAARVSRGLVIIKDHFEYGLVSRQMLRLMDVVGNRGYGVPIPDAYFTADSFADWIAGGGLTERERTVGIDLYERLGVVGRLFRPEWQFLSVLAPAAA